MIQKIRIHNFKCLCDLSLLLDYSEGKAPNGFENAPYIPFFQKERNTRIIPVLALYGANASGKTSILQAVSTLRSVILHGASPVYFFPNKISSPLQETRGTEFQLDFWTEGKPFSYALSYNADQILSEKLLQGSEVIFEIEAAELKASAFSGDQAPRIAAAFHAACVNARSGLQSQTFLQRLPHELPGISSELIAAQEFFNKRLFCLSGTQIAASDGIRLLSEHYKEQGNLSEKEAKRKALKEIASYLSRLDIHIHDLQLESKSMSGFYRSMPPGFQKTLGENFPMPDMLDEIYTYHRTQSGGCVQFHLEEESEGTKRLVGFLGFLLAALKSGHTVLIDEIDQSLHCLIVNQLIQLFKERRANTSGAQLICTLHETELLEINLLRISEVGIVRQHGFDGTKVVRLAEIKGLKNTDKFRHMYLRGDFGGIPFPYI